MQLITRNGYRLRPMIARDLTSAYLAWFNMPYVKAGLNLGARELTRADHATHIAQCATVGHDLYLLFDKKKNLLNYYFRLVRVPVAGVAELDIAADIADPLRSDRLRDAVRAIIEHGFTKLNLHKIKLRINRSNIAARYYADQSRFRLEAIRRKEVRHASGRIEDVLVYGLLRREYHTPPTPIAERQS